MNDVHDLIAEYALTTHPEGGFYRETDGVRQTGFPVEKGGQLSATLTKRWAEGEFNLYARHTDDQNTFYTAVPLVSRNDSRARAACSPLGTARASEAHPSAAATAASWPPLT